MSNKDPDVTIAPGATYFLHITFAGEELRFNREPPLLTRKTHCVHVIALDGDSVVEETTLTGTLPRPFGAGWEHVSGSTFRRTRRQDP